MANTDEDDDGGGGHGGASSTKGNVLFKNSIVISITFLLLYLPPTLEAPVARGRQHWRYRKWNDVSHKDKTTEGQSVYHR